MRGHREKTVPASQEERPQEEPALAHHGLRLPSSRTGEKNFSEELDKAAEQCHGGPTAPLSKEEGRPRGSLRENFLGGKETPASGKFGPRQSHVLVVKVTGG
jgi:hypothetical protein